MTTFLEQPSRTRGSNLVSTRRTEAEWASADPTLRAGQIAFSTDLRQMRVGDGTRPWSELEPFSAEPVINESVAQQVLNAAEGYLLGSALAVPKYGLQARASFRWRFWATKTAAGVATPIIKVKVGIAGTTADTTRVTHTMPAQTGAADHALIEVIAVLRNVGAAAVLSSVCRINHKLENTGFSVIPAPADIVVSGAFTTLVDDLILGLAVDPGAAGVWSVEGVLSEMMDT